MRKATYGNWCHLIHFSDSLASVARTVVEIVNNRLFDVWPEWQKLLLPVAAGCACTFLFCLII
jgi:hypothetical protein